MPIGNIINHEVRFQQIGTGVSSYVEIQDHLESGLVSPFIETRCILRCCTPFDLVNRNLTSVASKEAWVIPAISLGSVQCGQSVNKWATQYSISLSHCDANGSIFLRCDQYLITCITCQNNIPNLSELRLQLTMVNTERNGPPLQQT